jgi:pimeloyl-ACP methyl ester carboxylesterase
MSKAKSRNKSSRPSPSRSAAPAHYAPITVSGRWIASALALIFIGAAVCVWGALCLMFWLGSWQLLYHPSATVRRTPASAGLAFDPVAFAASDTGVPQLHGWWIPASSGSRFTAIYFHGADGNLGDTIDGLAQLHSAGLNILAFDYRGYGQSQFIHPSEARWREDADSALQYLTGTRHVAASSIILVGSGLGANLALEIAAAHPELAGVVLDQPLPSPMDAIFRDPRVRLVPAHLLVHDRWDAPATALRIPSLWLVVNNAQTGPATLVSSRVTSPKMVVFLSNDGKQVSESAAALSRWLDSLPQNRK